MVPCTANLNLQTTLHFEVILLDGLQFYFTPLALRSDEIASRMGVSPSGRHKRKSRGRILKKINPAQAQSVRDMILRIIPQDERVGEIITKSVDNFSLKLNFQGEAKMNRARTFIALLFISALGIFSIPLQADESMREMSALTQEPLELFHHYFTQCPEFIGGKQVNRPFFQHYPEVQKFVTHQPAVISAEQFHQTIQDFIAMKNKEHADAARWFAKKLPVVDQRKDYSGAHVQRMAVSQGIRIVLIGDLHGSIHAFLRVLCKLMASGLLNKDLTVPNDVRIVFTGDMVDYGFYSADTLFWALHLAVKNPTRVVLCRGNHEDVSLSSRMGFYDELEARYDRAGFTLKLFEAAQEAFKKMPLALFIGIEANLANGYMMCCHGGVEEREAASIIVPFLKSEFSYAALNVNKCEGFNWNDFTGLEAQGRSWTPNFRGGQLRMYTIKGTQDFMKMCNIALIERGHLDKVDSFKILVQGEEHPVPVFPTLCCDPHSSPRITHMMNRTFGSREILWNKGFALADLPLDMFPVFTHSNASASKMNGSEGCGLVTVGKTWQESQHRAYIYTNELMQARGHLNEEDREGRTRPMIPTAQAYQAVLLQPHYTSIDAKGNVHMWLEKNFPLPTIAQRDPGRISSLFSHYQRPLGIQPGISAGF